MLAADAPETDALIEDRSIYVVLLELLVWLASGTFEALAAFAETPIAADSLSPTKGMLLAKSAIAL